MVSHFLRYHLFWQKTQLLVIEIFTSYPAPKNHLNFFISLVKEELLKLK